MKRNYKRLMGLSNKCAYYQTKNLEKSISYFSSIDEEVNLLIEKGTDFSFECGGAFYKCPIKNFKPYFRPLFKMATHKEIASVKADDTHAVDFEVPLGTEVYSVSKGVITAIKNDRVSGGNNPEYAGNDNYVYIYNNVENRIFCYRHLEKNENLFLNKNITECEILGKTGMTGYVITPHLHFVIYQIDKNKKIILKSLPIKFI